VVTSGLLLLPSHYPIRPGSNCSSFAPLPSQQLSILYFYGRPVHDWRSPLVHFFFFQPHFLPGVCKIQYVTEFSFPRVVVAHSRLPLLGLFCPDPVLLTSCFRRLCRPPQVAELLVSPFSENSLAKTLFPRLLLVHWRVFFNHFFPNPCFRSCSSAPFLGVHAFFFEFDGFRP